MSTVSIGFKRSSLLLKESVCVEGWEEPIWVALESGVGGQDCGVRIYSQAGYMPAWVRKHILINTLATLFRDNR